MPLASIGPALRGAARKRWPAGRRLRRAPGRTVRGCRRAHHTVPGDPGVGADRLGHGHFRGRRRRRRLRRPDRQSGRCAGPGDRCRPEKTRNHRPVRRRDLQCGANGIQGPAQGRLRQGQGEGPAAYGVEDFRDLRHGRGQQPGGHRRGRRAHPPRPCLALGVVEVDRPGLGPNCASLADAELERLLAETRGVPGCDADTMARGYQAVQARVQALAPILPLYSPHALYVLGPRLAGWQPGPWSVYQVPAISAVGRATAD